MENIFKYEIVQSRDDDKFDRYRPGDNTKLFSYIEIKGFKENQFIKDLIIPSQIEGYNVRTIASKAFENEKISSLTIPSSLVYIGSQAFQNCDELEEVKSITTNIKRPDVFNNEEEWLREYYYDDNTGSEIFENCYKLKKADFSKSHIYTIEYNNFENTKIEEIIFSQNSYYENKIGNKWRSWDLPKLEKLVFPNKENSLKIIGETFKNCPMLKEVELPYNIKLLEEPFGAHTTLINIKDVNKPSITGKTILRWFYPGLKEYIPQKEDKYIYRNTFNGNPDLETITISKNIKNIEKNAFNNCNNIEIIKIEEGACSIEENIFLGSNNIKEIIVPNLKYFLNSPGLLSIPAKITVLNKSDLDYIELDNNLKSDNSFYFKDIITFQTPPNMKHIETGTFQNHPKLKKLLITKNIKSIFVNSFSNCFNLEVICLESDITQINSFAFDNSDNLKKIFLPNLDALLKSGIYKNKAEYIIENEKLQNYDVEKCVDSEVSLNIFSNIVRTNTRNVYEQLKPTGIFEKLKFNTKAFVDVFNIAIEKDYVELVKAISEDGKIHKRRINQYIDHAQSNDANKVLVYLTEWKNNNIDLKDERKKELSKAKKLMSDPDAMLRNIYNFRKNKDFGLGVTYKDKSKLSSIQLIDFPDKYKGEFVTYLPAQSLKESSIVEVILPKKLKYVGNETFYSCMNLKVINLPAGTNIGENAFNQCRSLEKIIIKNNRLGDVGMFAFSYTSSLEELDLSGGVGEIGKYAFANSGIRKLILPESSPVIGIGAFINCPNLVDVTLPKDLPQIQRRMFADCTSLKEIELPDSVKKILTQAFYRCRNLEKIVIPSSVTQIGHDAFEGCDKLVIYVERGSDAHRIAVKNDLKYEFI